MSDLADREKIVQEKEALRHVMRARSDACRPMPSSSAARMCAFLASAGFMAKATLLIGFIPIKDEPDIMPVMGFWLENGSRLMLPVYDHEKKVYCLAEVSGLGSEWLVSGKYGILEPKPEIPRQSCPYDFDEHAVWLVPGMAFTRTGERLGRGKGYYDRLLNGTRATKVGVLTDSQILAHIPVQAHDAKMDYLLTETGIINCKDYRKAQRSQERIQVKNVGVNSII